jgi:hypothetical protein
MIESIAKLPAHTQAVSNIDVTAILADALLNV